MFNRLGTSRVASELLTNIQPDTGPAVEPSAPTPPPGQPAARIPPEILSGVVSRPPIGTPGGEVFIPPRPFPLPQPLPLPTLDPFIPRFAGPQTTTVLAQSAISQLDAAPRDILDNAIGLASKFPAAGLMEELRHRTNFDQIISELAEGWDMKTRSIFAEVFGIGQDQFQIMDTIVSLAILNRPDLESVLRQENTPTPSQSDLLENRQIVWQYPPGGTPLSPPYLVLVAVERLDTAPAEGVVQSILGSLVPYRNFLISKEAARKLG